MISEKNNLSIKDHVIKVTKKMVKNLIQISPTGPLMLHIVLNIVRRNTVMIKFELLIVLEKRMNRVRKREETRK